MTWREYHEATKHSVESLRRAPHGLDWANMPDPFRHYEGVPVLDLPSDPPVPQTPALGLLQGGSGFSTAADGATFLSQLLFNSAAVSASKRVGSTANRYALRVNPSSGNLHPTEFHFRTRGLMDWPDGQYHYRPSAHMAEQRAVGEVSFASDAPIVFLLTSIAWREAWKYRDRAYRYCLHDAGHAWQALALAARAMGCETQAFGHFPDDAVARGWRLPDDEWPMLLVELRGRAIPVREPDAGDAVWYDGQANPLSAEPIVYPLLESVQHATKLGDGRGIPAAEPAGSGSGEMQLPAPAASARAFGEVVRGRRSALDFVGGARSMSLPQLSAILAAASQPLAADFAGERFVQLYLYVHRVDGLEPGVYRYWPAEEKVGRGDTPADVSPSGFGGLRDQIKRGDQRVAAAGLSLGQDLAGNACVAFSMIADIERAARAHGDRGYRYVHFEAGAVGQRLYLAAEALGLGATGIGAFYDDQVHRYLNLAPEQGQVVYHFAIGYPVPDPRLDA
jgi:SagB-type dehydrogenase family enzyme